MQTKGLQKIDRQSLIDLCTNAENAEVAIQILSGFDHLTREQRNEIVCTGLLVAALRDDDFKRLILRAKSQNKLFSFWLWMGLNHPFRKKLFNYTFNLERFGYSGRRLLNRNGKRFAQFFCGKSKPSLEIEL